MTDFLVKRFINAPVSSNCYIIYPKGYGHCLIVDPGSKDITKINLFLKEENLKVDFIILTHHHFDHIWGVDQLNLIHNAKVISSRNCAHKVGDRKLNLSSFYEDSGFTISQPEIYIEQLNYKLHWQNAIFDFYHTPGHSDSCITIHVNEKLFTGDALIKDVDILTKLPGGSKHQLKETYNKYHTLLDYNTQLTVYPGHGEVFELKAEDLIIKK